MRLQHRITPLALAEPFTHARGSWSTVETVLAQVVHEGLTGTGEGAPSRHRGEDPASASRFLEAAAGVLGDDPFAAHRIDAALDALSTEHGAQTAARAALDAALHDLRGQLIGLPVWRLLGLPRGGPPTTWSISLADPDTMARAAERATGWRCLKVKLGGGDGLDLVRIRAIRQVSRQPLIVDVNEHWEPAEAEQTIGALADFGVLLVEQPLPAGHPDTPLLTARSPLPIYLDEECRRAADVVRCSDRCHGVSVKTSKCGGLTQILRICAVARAHGLGVLLGCDLESSVGITAATHVAALADHVDLDGNLLLAYDPWVGAQLVDGVQMPPDRPGLGLHPRPPGPDTQP